MLSTVAEAGALADAVHRALDARQRCGGDTGEAQALDLVLCLRDYGTLVGEINRRLEVAYAQLRRGSGHEVLLACEASPPLFPWIAAIASVDRRLASSLRAESPEAIEAPPRLAERLIAAIREAFPGIDQPYRQLGLASDAPLATGGLDERVERLRTVVSSLENPRGWLDVLAGYELQWVRQLTSELEGMAELSEAEVTPPIVERADEVFALLRGGAWLNPLDIRTVQRLHDALLRVQAVSACRERTEAAEAVLRDHEVHGCRGMGLTLARFQAVLHAADPESDAPTIARAKEILRSCREEETRLENERQAEVHRVELESLVKARIPVRPWLAAELLDAVTAELQAVRELAQAAAVSERFDHLSMQGERKVAAIRRRLSMTRRLTVLAVASSLAAVSTVAWLRYRDHQMGKVREFVSARIVNGLLEVEQLASAEAEWNALLRRHPWLETDPLHAVFVDRSDMLRRSVEEDRSGFRRNVDEADRIARDVLGRNTATLRGDGDRGDLDRLCDDSRAEHRRATDLHVEASGIAARMRSILGDDATEESWRILQLSEDTLRGAWTAYEDARDDRIRREIELLQRDVRELKERIESFTAARATSASAEIDSRLTVLERCGSGLVSAVLRQDVAEIRERSIRLEAIEKQIEELDDAAEEGLVSYLAAVRRQGREVSEPRRGVRAEALQDLEAGDAAEAWAKLEPLWSLRDPVTTSQAQALLDAIDEAMLQHRPGAETIVDMIARVRALLSDLATSNRGMLVPLQSYLSLPSLGQNRAVYSLSLDDPAELGQSLLFYTTRSDAASALFFETESQVGNYARFGRREYARLSVGLRNNAGKLTPAVHGGMCDDMRAVVDDVVRGKRNVDQGIVALLGCLADAGKTAPPVDPLLRARLLQFVVKAASGSSCLASYESLQELQRRLEQLSQPGLATWVNPVQRDRAAEKAAVEIVDAPAVVAKIIADHARTRGLLGALPGFFRRMPFVGWLEERQKGGPVTLHAASNDHTAVSGRLMVLVMGMKGWEKVAVGEIVDGMPTIDVVDALRGTCFGRPVFLESAGMTVNGRR